MTRRLAAAALVVTAAAAVWLAMAGASAQAPTVVNTTFTPDFPREVRVSALIRDGEVSEAVLLYRVLPEGAITRLAAEVRSGDATRLEADIPTSRDDVWIPAGAVFEWQWQLQTPDGGEHLTDLQQWTYDDPRYEWREVQRPNLVIRYYQAEELATVLADEGIDAIADVESLLGAELTETARIVVWLGPDDARGVDRQGSETYDAAVLTGGQRVLADLIHVYTPTRWVVRHELAHILTKVAGEGGIGSLPSWLDEGVATITEGDWRVRRQPSLDEAIRSDSVLALRGMRAAPNEPGLVDLFYAQSAATVQFLINEHGEAKIAELFAVFKRGATTEDALIEVYGFGRDELEDAWRASVGLDPRERGEDRSTTIEDEVIAGPVIVIADDGETAANPASDAPTDAAEEAGTATGTEQAAPASDDAQAAGQDRRSPEQVEARRDEIRGRLAERRTAPVFELDGGFPWEYPLIAAAGALLLLSAAAAARLLARAGS